MYWRPTDFKLGPCCPKKRNLSVTDADFTMTSAGAGSRILFFSIHSIALLQMCAKIKQDKKFVSKRLIFWDGLRNVSTPFPWRVRQAGSASQSWPVPWSRTENHTTTIRASEIYFSAFPTDPIQSKLQNKTSSSSVISRRSVCIQAS